MCQVSKGHLGSSALRRSAELALGVCHNIRNQSAGHTRFPSSFAGLQRRQPEAGQVKRHAQTHRRLATTCRRKHQFLTIKLEISIVALGCVFLGGAQWAPLLEVTQCAVFLFGHHPGLMAMVSAYHVESYHCVWKHM